MHQKEREVDMSREGHVLRRMLDAPVQERDGEEDRQPGGHVKRRRARAKKNVRYRKETERKTAYKRRD